MILNDFQSFHPGLDFFKFQTFRAWTGRYVFVMWQEPRMNCNKARLLKRLLNKKKLYIFCYFLKIIKDFFIKMIKDALFY